MATLPAAAHVQAMGWAEQAYPTGTDLERYWIQLISALESQYAKGWKGAGVGSWNMGAVQAGHAPCNPATSFEYTDSHPNADGTSTKYTICFKKYAGPVEGMADVGRILFKQMKITAKTLRELSTQMYDAHYYEGFGATREARISNHVKGLEKWADEISAATGQPRPPTDEEGSAPSPKGPDYSGWSLSQFLGLFLSELRSDADSGHFMVLPPKAKRVVVEYQKSRGLKTDGIVGSKQTIPQIMKELGR